MRHLAFPDGLRHQQHHATQMARRHRELVSGSAGCGRGALRRGESAAYRRAIWIAACALVVACGTPTATGPDISGSYVLRTVNGATDRAGEVLVVTRDGHWHETSTSEGTWVQSDSIVSFVALTNGPYGGTGFYGRRTATGFALSDPAGGHYVFEFVK